MNALFPLFVVATTIWSELTPADADGRMEP